MSKLGKGSFERVWVYSTELTPQTCSWQNKSKKGNCIFFQNILVLFKKNGVKTGCVAWTLMW